MEEGRIVADTPPVGRRFRNVWAFALGAYTAALLFEEFVVSGLLIHPRTPDLWDMSWALRVAYVGPETLACVGAGMGMRSWRAVLLFGLASSGIRAAFHAFQTLRGAEGYLHAQETLPVALPVMLLVMALVHAALAAIGRAGSMSLARWRANRNGG